MAGLSWTLKFFRFAGERHATSAVRFEPAKRATDYLNHFNEIVMTLEMIPDMSELLEEAQTWLPKGYREHLGDSTPSWEADAPRIMG